MTTSMLDADSFLVVDVGKLSTRAMLFDVVDGRYRYLGSGTGPTTASAPYHSISEGVRMALDDLKSVTGRTLTGADEQLIRPSSSDGSGVDAFAATVSAGPLIKIVVVGLLESMSVESARRLANSIYGQVDYIISLNDRKKPEERLDAILQLQPDLVIVAGGTEGGASQSVLTLLEAVGLACYLLPVEKRPDVLFVGNQALQGEINARIGDLVSLHFAPNLRPTLEVEHLDASRAGLARVYGNIRSRQLAGVNELNEWSSNSNIMPPSMAFGRVVQFLSKVHASNKGVLGIDVGASSLTLVASYDGEVALSVYPQFQSLNDPANTIMECPIDEIKRWLTVELSDDAIYEFLLEKALHPESVPAEFEDYAVEQALIRQSLNNAVTEAQKNFPPSMDASKIGLLPWVEPIIATGSALTSTPSLAHSVLTLLDGLQPNGVTTLIVDQYRIASALGAAASGNPMLMIQLLDSSAFLHVGTIIAPVGKARPGTPILRMKVTYESGHVTDLEVKQGDFDVLPLPQGQSARLQLQPLQRFDIGMGAPGRSGSLRVTGGALGVIIDARGRPVSLPNDIQRRAELYKKWLWTLGAQ